MKIFWYSFAITIIIGLCIGWVMNLIKLLGMLSEPITAWFIARIVGIFAAPFGGLIGWF